MYKIIISVLATTIFLMLCVATYANADGLFAKTTQVKQWTVDSYPHADTPSVTACTKAINGSPALLCVRFDRNVISFHVHTKQNTVNCKKVMYTLDRVNYQTVQARTREFGGTLYLQDSIDLYGQIVNELYPTISGDILDIYYNVSPGCNIPESRFCVDDLQRAIVIGMS